MPISIAEELLARHSVDPVRGFLPAEDPATNLPGKFAEWEELASELPKLLGAGRARREIVSMSLLSTEGLEDRRLRDRAMLLLSYLGHAYVYAEEQPADSVPAPLARPWCEIAEMVGRPPVLSYASHALVNWRRFDRGLPVELGNTARLENFLGGVDEDWFVLVHIAIEAAAAPGLAAAAAAQDQAREDDLDGVAKSLATVGDSMERMLATLRRMPEKCDPYIYYNRVRQFIFGWMDNPALPKGVWYEGVDKYRGEPQKFRGETGAQSAVIPSFDAVLGADYSQDVLGAHLLELRAYMPPEHRAFIAELESRTSVRDYVVRNADTNRLREAYNRCVSLSGQFRRQHLEYAADYIRSQQGGSAANPVETGTGGTPFMRYLTQHMQDTDKYLIVLSPAQGRTQG